MSDRNTKLQYRWIEVTICGGRNGATLIDIDFAMPCYVNRFAVVVKSGENRH